MITYPEHRPVVVATLLLMWCALLLAYRVHLSYDSLPIWLAGNLLLAAIPLVCSTLLAVAARKRRGIVAVALFGLWLLFLPNAPYIITDLIHLTRPSPLPLWFNVALLASCAATGVVLGYLSLLDVHGVVDRRFGPRAGWTVAGGSLLLSGFGIYLGRFLRWNSWNLFTDPLRLAHGMLDAFTRPGGHPEPVPVTLVYGVGLVIGYVALRVLTAPGRSASIAQDTAQA